jgi:hypothetical protein
MIDVVVEKTVAKTHYWQQQHGVIAQDGFRYEQIKYISLLD